EGIARAVEIDDPDVIVYLNLNLKVDAAFAVPGVRAVAAGEADVAIGTRASAEGGQALGRGLLGEAKSRGFNLLARALLPALRPYADTNAPLKVLSRRAAGLLLEEARVPHVTLDCEWLVIFHAHRLRVQAYPVVWRQRDGSKIPWHVTGQSLLDLIHLRRRAFNRSPTCSKP
ncbi:MAG: hypothetical protein JKY65_26035, partial [Planctomycetes bacterium]|nr:hypothetical protein [Planctomycetota bacterium]